MSDDSGIVNIPGAFLNKTSLPDTCAKQESQSVVQGSKLPFPTTQTAALCCKTSKSP